MIGRDDSPSTDVEAELLRTNQPIISATASSEPIIATRVLFMAIANWEVGQLRLCSGPCQRSLQIFDALYHEPTCTELNQTVADRVELSPIEPNRRRSSQTGADRVKQAWNGCVDCMAEPSNLVGGLIPGFTKPALLVT